MAPRDTKELFITFVTLENDEQDGKSADTYFF